MPRATTSEECVTRIVIVGGGFGGLYTALELEKTLARDPDVEVTLVNRENFFLFTPMLHEVAASDLDLTHIVSPFRALLHRVSFFEGVVERIDLPNRRVHVSHGLDSHVHELPFDHVVLALGSVTNFHGQPELEAHALTMKTLGDAIHLRNRLIAHLEEADRECTNDHRESLLTFVVAGGGFAGVETIAGINDFVREALRFYPKLDEAGVRMLLVHPGTVILPELGEKLGAYAQVKLAERGIEIHTGVKVQSFVNGHVTLTDGSAFQAGTLVWTAGTSPNPLLEGLPCPLDRGRLIVDEFLQVPGWPGVWALGDCAVVPDRRTGMPHPPTAQHALREGRVLARNLTAEVRGGQKTPFDFRALGQLAAIGRRTGAARILGRNFSGFFAWWLWRTIYLSKLPRFERKLRVAIDWTLDLFFEKDFVQYLTERAPALMREASPDERPTGAAPSATQVVIDHGVAASA